MKKTTIFFLIATTFILFSCANTATYNEAELIRKIDELQFTVNQLALKVAQLEEKQLHPVGTTPTATTTTTSVTTTTKKTPTKVTTKPLTTVTTSTTKSIFLGAEFQNQYENYKKQISLLSQTIASTIPKDVETDRIDQFYQYQSAIIVVNDELNQYQLLMKDAYDNDILTQEEFIEKERLLKKLNDALILLEDQLEFKFDMVAS